MEDETEIEELWKKGLIDPVTYIELKYRITKEEAILRLNKDYFKGFKLFSIIEWEKYGYRETKESNRERGGKWWNSE